MTDSIKPGLRGSEKASPDAHADDDDRLSIETVIASLGSRSNAEREALLKALLDGENEPHRPPHGASRISRSSVHFRGLLLGRETRYLVGSHASCRIVLTSGVGISNCPQRLLLDANRLSIRR